jgi:F-box-like
LTDWCDVARVTIDELPDVSLLKIFELYVDEEERIEAWHALVHVCRKWRNIVFRSPRRLDLRLYCTASTPVSDTIDVWPLLPIKICINVMEASFNGHLLLLDDSLYAALGHNDRICQLSLFDAPSFKLEKVLAAIQKPFLALTCLELLQPSYHGETALIYPDSFLGGSAPCLQTLRLDCIPFPGLPKLLLSATHLVDLDLRRIPFSGYISPEAVVTCLSGLTRLERLTIRFKSPRCRPDQKSRRPPPLTRTDLPVLTKLNFKGVSEYLEDLVARINAPLLDKLSIVFFHQLIFDTPLLTQFISRVPNLKTHDGAQLLVAFSDEETWVTFPRTPDGSHGTLQLGISCRQPDWQLSSLAQVFSLPFAQALIPVVEHLYILEKGFTRRQWQDDIESTQWLELFHPFTAVKALYMAREFTPRIVPTLLAPFDEGMTEVFPALQFLLPEEPLLFGGIPLGPAVPTEDIAKFVLARKLAGLPVSVSIWKGIML